MRMQWKLLHCVAALVVFFGFVEQRKIDATYFDNVRYVSSIFGSYVKRKPEHETAPREYHTLEIIVYVRILREIFQNIRMIYAFAHVSFG